MTMTMQSKLHLVLFASHPLSQRSPTFSALWTSDGSDSGSGWGKERGCSQKGSFVSKGVGLPTTHTSRAASTSALARHLHGPVPGCNLEVGDPCFKCFQYLPKTFLCKASPYHKIAIAILECKTGTAAQSRWKQIHNYGLLKLYSIDL